MSGFRLSGRAKRDLADIRETGVERFGAIAAERHLAGFDRLFALLRRHPRAGEPRPEIGPAMRAIGHPPHRLIYRADAGGVLIVRILHQRQDVAAASER